MKKNMDMLEYTLIILLALCIVFTGISASYNKSVFFFEAAATVLAAAFVIFRIIFTRRDSRKFLEYISRRLGTVDKEALAKFPLPVAVVDSSNKILWANGVFCENIMKNSEFFGASAESLFEGFDRYSAFTPNGSPVKGKTGDYLVYATSSSEGKEELYGLYFIDKSKEVYISELYDESRPAVLSIMLDSLDDLFANSKESERSRAMGEIEKLFEDFAAESHALVKHYDNSHYVAIVEEKYLEKMIEERFPILDKARKILSGDELPVTLSIGVAHGEYSLDKLTELADQALEMALGRGGDQTAVYNINGFEFYGGFSKGVEKRNKVKTRVVAAALSDMIDSAGNVLVMGHRSGDLDCIGSAFAMAEACRDMGKQANIVVRREQCLAVSLIDRVEKSGNLEFFISPEEALERLTDGTLLIIVDTHIPGILESKDLYTRCRNVVVIDHHRRALDCIENAVIFYHEPHASSASEMVTELLEYFDGRSKMTKLEAEALLSGIMLDTKSFSMRAGVRTFEAAAYLRKIGADTVNVKMLFSGSLESYQHRSAIVSAAEIYRNIAVSFSENCSDIALVAPQAADELLTIEGVSASVVMFATETGISFSARSLGTVNVQVIMESLGGGGHQTMAGAQMAGIEPAQAKIMLMNVIDDYWDKANGHDE